MSRAIAKLKDRGRAHELKEEWDKAIAAYVEVLKIGESEGEPELGIFNRVGDLFLKIGRSADAVQYYERAADHYADQGLYNNAIALCNKALRYLPNRAELLLKLGQFSAAQGFFTDARRWFLQYAEKQMKAGKLDAAFDALEEFARLSDDPEVREILAEQLQAHGRTEAGLDQLRAAYALRLRTGEQAAAATLRDQILELDPNADLEGAAAVLPKPEPTRPSDDAFMLPGLAEIGTTEQVAEAEAEDEPEALPSLEVERTSLAGDDTAEDEGEAAADAGAGPDLEVDAGDTETAGRVDGLEAAFAGFDSVPGLQKIEGLEGEEEVGEVAPLPGLETDEVAEEEPSAADVPDDLPLLDAGEDEADAEPLPLLDDPSVELDDARLDAADESGAEATPGEADETPADGMFDLGALDFGGPRAEGKRLPPKPEGDDTRLDDLELTWGETAAEEEAPPEAAAGADDLDFSWGGVESPAAEVEEATTPEPEPDVEEPAAELEEIARAEAAPDEADSAPEPAPPPAAPATPRRVTPAVAIARAREYRAAGREQDAATELERSARELAGEDRLADAVEVLSELTRLQPDDVNAQQRRVEYAFKLGRRDLLIPSYLGLAKSLARSGQPAKATAVYHRLLDLDPENAEARSALAPPRPAAKPKPPSPKPEGGFIDLGSLVLEDDEEETTRFVVPESEPTGDEEKDFAAMLSQFKEKVAENLGAEDWNSHYDLGLAYKEMGLVDEAIAEFQTALRGGGERLKVYEELGQCFIAKSQYNIAVKLLNRALQMPFDDEADLVGVYYQLGICYEGLGKKDEARESYEQVLGLDISFRDVNDRLARL